MLVFDGHADLGVDADLDDYHHVMIWRREELGDFSVSLTFLLTPTPPHPYHQPHPHPSPDCSVSIICVFPSIYISDQLLTILN